MLTVDSFLVWQAFKDAVRSRARALWATFVVGWLLLIALILTCAFAGLRLNTSPSVPLGFYRLSSQAPARGDYVFLCPPPTPLFVRARAHGYLSSGSCPSDFVPMFKVLAATTGDAVQIQLEGVRVNGVLWPRSAPLRMDATGRPLPQLSGYRGVLRTGEVLLMSNDCDLGFDGRYFGALPSSAIRASAIPLITW